MPRVTRRFWFALAGVGVLVTAFLIGPLLAWQARERAVNQRIEKLRDRIDKHARRWGLDPLLVASVVRHESSGRPEVVSSANAVGLMQITPITLTEVRDHMRCVGRGQLTDPDYNLEVGCAYLAALRDRFKNEPRLMLAAYHMGPTAVARLVNKYPGLGPDPVLADAAVGPQTKAYVAGVYSDWQAAVSKREEERMRAQAESEAKAVRASETLPVPPSPSAPGSTPSRQTK